MPEEQNIQVLSLVISMAAAISAAIAAVASLYITRLTQKENQAELFFFFRDRYTEERFNDALRDLWNWREKHGDDYLEKWYEGYQNGDQRALDLNRARRRVSRYFIDVARLYKSGFINKKLARIVTANSGFNILTEICEPMSEKIESHYSPEYSRVLREIRKSYRSGDLD